MIRFLISFVLGTTLTFCASQMPGQENSRPRTTKPDEDFRDVLDEVLAGRAKKPACLVDSCGLPRQLVITSNGTGLFEQPRPGAKRVHDLALYDRLFVFSVDDGNGYHKAGVTPWEDSVIGWVPSVYCLLWDHNEAVFLSGRSLPEGVDRISVWESKEKAEFGDPRQAMYVVPIDRDTREAQAFYPILEASESRTVYKIGVLHGGDQEWRDEYGQRIAEESLKELVSNLHAVNVVFLLDTNGKMAEFVTEFMRNAHGIFDDVSSGPNPENIDVPEVPLTVSLGCVAYQDESEHYKIKQVAELTSDRRRFSDDISALRKEHTQTGIQALEHCLEKHPFPRGALNRIIWITDTAPTELRDEVLSQLGAKARGRFVQIDVMLCGGDDVTRSAYEAISRRSGGNVYPILEPKSLISAVSTALKSRLAYIPMEKRFLEAAIIPEQEYRATMMLQQLLELSPAGDVESAANNYRKAVKLRRFLAARGLDVRGWELRTAWIQVKPGGREPLRLYVAVPRWQVANAVSGSLGVLEKASRGTDFTANSRTFLANIMALHAGHFTCVGIESNEPASRAQNLPVVSDSIRLGDTGVSRFARTYRDKMLKLIDYWRTPATHEGELVFIPMDVLP